MDISEPSAQASAVLELHGYRYSVYSWIARVALTEKQLTFRTVEVNPFAEPGGGGDLGLHPFGKVPVLIHDGFLLFETVAITRYINDAFEGPRLVEDDPRCRARGDQIISVVDNYAYWPLVRQIFAHGVFRPRVGEAADEAELEMGFAAAPRVLRVLDALVGTQGVMRSGAPTLADIHLAPMIAYFVSVSRGARLLASFEQLSNWWRTLSGWPSLVKTRPQLPQ